MNPKAPHGRGNVQAEIATRAAWFVLRILGVFGLFPFRVLPLGPPLKPVTGVGGETGLLCAVGRVRGTRDGRREPLNAEARGRVGVGVWRGVVWCVGGRKGGSEWEVGTVVMDMWGVRCLAPSNWSGIAPRSPKRHHTP